MKNLPTIEEVRRASERVGGNASAEHAFALIKVYGADTLRVVADVAKEMLLDRIAAAEARLKAPRRLT